MLIYHNLIVNFHFFFPLKYAAASLCWQDLITIVNVTKAQFVCLSTVSHLTHAICFLKTPWVLSCSVIRLIYKPNMANNFTPNPPLYLPIWRQLVKPAALLVMVLASVCVFNA